MADLYPFESSHCLSVSTRQALMTMLTAGLLALLALTRPPKVWADGPIYVDRDALGPANDGLSWTTAYTDVQDALAVAALGDEIWVAEGVYTPGSTLTATFHLSNGVALYGGFGGYGISETLRTQRDWGVHVTVLSGDIDHNDIIDPNGVITTTANITGNNAYHVVTGSGTDTTAVLDGFTVTGGNAIGFDIPDERGGGMYSQDPFYNPVLINCIFWSNTAPVGPQIYNETNAPSVTYSLVQGGYPGTGNLDADPFFVDADGPDNIVGTLDDDLRLQLVSPAIDAGDNRAVPADTADLDGDGDTAEPLPLDLAGNPRFIDIADKADTGNGTAPIVDMGAHETVVAGPMNYCYLPIVLKNWVRYGTP